MYQTLQTPVAWLYHLLSELVHVLLLFLYGLLRLFLGCFKAFDLILERLYLSWIDAIILLTTLSSQHSEVRDHHIPC